MVIEQDPIFNGLINGISTINKLSFQYISYVWLLKCTWSGNTFFEQVSQVLSIILKLTYIRYYMRCIFLDYYAIFEWASLPKLTSQMCIMHITYVTTQKNPILDFSSPLVFPCHSEVMCIMHILNPKIILLNFIFIAQIILPFSSQN
jgi:hypothetical protein